MMDHPHYAYSPLPTRPRTAWPGDASLAAFVLLYVEHWELAPPAGEHRDPRFVGEYGSFFPDYRSWTQREYGARIGVFRVLDALDAAGIVPAVPINALAIERYPQLVEKLAARNVEFVAHGLASTRMLTSRMSADAERETIARTIEVITQATGKRPAGWCGQDFGESTRTPQLVAETGLSYLLDWPNDDQPYWLTTTPGVVSIPNQADWDDVQMQWLRRVPAHEYAKQVLAAFDTLRDEGAASGRVFGLGVHPWVSGMTNRIRYLGEALTTMRTRPGVWWSTPADIATAFESQTIATSGTATP
jgi:allantoinase